MANFETIDLSGNNIGSTTRVNGNPVTFPTELTGQLMATRKSEDQQDLFIPTPQNPNPNAFDSSAHTLPRVSLDRAVDHRGGSGLPVRSRSSARCGRSTHANLRGGYTFIWVGDVIETNESVDYRGNPMAGLKPRIEVSRGSWWSDNWSVGCFVELVRAG